MHRLVFMHWIWLLVLAGALAGGCGDDDSDGDAEGTDESQELEHGLTKAQAEEVLVKVGDTTITVGQFAERLADQSPYLRARYNSPERRRDFLDDMIRFELLALEAERRGLDDLPEVRRNTKQVMIEQMMKEMFEERIKLSDISDEEIKAYYEDNRDEFHKPEQRRASHILIRSRGKARRVLQQIKASPDDANLFRELAEKHNEDPATEDRYGDLRFFAAPDEGDVDGEPEEARVPEEVAEAAFGLDKIGDIHPKLVRWKRGFSIVKLTGRRAALNRPLEQARRTIQNKLWRQKRQQAIEDFVEGLRDELEVEVDKDALDKVALNVPEGQTPTVSAPDPSVQPPEDDPAEAPEQAAEGAGEEAGGAQQ